MQEKPSGADAAVVQPLASPPAETETASGGCGYQGYEFGAGSYPDSICVDGRLFDADNCDDQGHLYEPADYLPCPGCCPDAAVEYWSDYKESRTIAIALVNDIRKNRGLPPVAEIGSGNQPAPEHSDATRRSEAP